MRDPILAAPCRRSETIDSGVLGAGLFDVQVVSGGGAPTSFRAGATAGGCATTTTVVQTTSGELAGVRNCRLPNTMVTTSVATTTGRARMVASSARAVRR